MAAANPVAIVLARVGEKEPLPLKLELAGRPVRFGISWLADAPTGKLYEITEDQQLGRFPRLVD